MAKIIRVLSQLAPGQRYMIRIASVGSDGTTSDLSPTYTFTTVKDITAPASPEVPVTDFSTPTLITSWSSSAAAVSTDFKDFQIIVSSPTSSTSGTYYSLSPFRFTVQDNINLFGSATPSINLQIRSRDTSGNLSDPLNTSASNAVPTNITNSTSSFSSPDLYLQWNTVTASSDNDITHYRLTLNNSIIPRTVVYSVPAISNSTTSALFQLTYQQNANDFGRPSGSFSGSVVAVDIFNQTSATPRTFTIVNPAPTDYPTLTISPIIKGFAASWSAPAASFADYSYTEIYTNATTPFSASNATPVWRGTGTYAEYSNFVTYNLTYVLARHFDLFGQPGPDSAIVSVTPINPVTADVIPPATPSAGFYSSATLDPTDIGGQRFNVTASWTPVTDSDLAGYYLKYSLTNTSSALGTVQATPASANYPVKTNFLGYAGNTYYWWVASYDKSNNTSSWSTLQTTNIPADTTAPASVTNFAIFGNDNIITASWTAVATSTDFNPPVGIGGYRVRSATDSGITTNVQTFNSLNNRIGFAVPLWNTTYYVTVQPFDTQGNLGASPTPLSIAIGTDPAISASTIAIGAQTSANGKNIIFYNASTTVPTATASGDTWFVVDSASALITALRTASAAGITSWVERPLTSATIAALDAGKITTGFLSAGRIQANSLSASLIAADTAFINQNLRLGGTASNQINLVANNASVAGKIYSGAVGSYNNATTGFYLDGDGYFSLKDRLTFNPITNVLTVAGSVVAQSGQFTGSMTAGTLAIGTFGGGLNGIKIDANNFWYDNNNFSLANGSVAWNGTTLSIDGRIIARSGSFSGNVQVGQNGSIFAGNSAISGARTIFNASGVQGFDTSGNSTFLLSGQDGRFSLGNSLTWDGTNLNINGNVNVQRAPTALNQDPQLSNPAAWAIVTGLASQTASFTTVSDGKVGPYVARSGSAQTWYNVAPQNRIIFDPTRSYRISAWVRNPSSPSANGNFYLGVAAFRDLSAGAGVSGGAPYADGSQWYYGVSNVAIPSGSAWIRYERYFGAGESRTFIDPANPATAGNIATACAAIYMSPLFIMNIGGTAGYMEIQDVRIEETISSGLIKTDLALVSRNLRIGDTASTQINLIAGVSGTPGKIYIGSTGLYSSSTTPFYTDGTGNFSLGAKFAWNGSTLTIGDPSSQTGFSAPAIPSSSNVALYAGASFSNASAAPFRVYYDGRVVATSGSFTGNIYANSGSFSGSVTSQYGNIGGWTISTNNLYASSAGNYYGMYLGTGKNVFFAGAIDNFGTNGKFIVNADGGLYATSASVSGTINAINGNVGPVQIGSNNVYFYNNQNVKPYQNLLTDPAFSFIPLWDTNTGSSQYNNWTYFNPSSSAGSYIPVSKSITASVSSFSIVGDLITVNTSGPHGLKINQVVHMVPYGYIVNGKPIVGYSSNAKDYDLTTNINNYKIALTEAIVNSIPTANQVVLYYPSSAVNIPSNPRFGYSSTTLGWNYSTSSWNTGGIAPDANASVSSFYVLYSTYAQVTGNPTNSNPGVRTLDTVPVIPNSQYVFSSYVLSEKPSPSFVAGIEFFDDIPYPSLVADVNSLLSPVRVYSSSTVASSAQWTRVSVSGISASTTLYGRVFIQELGNSSSLTKSYFSGAQLELGSTPTRLEDDGRDGVGLINFSKNQIYNASKATANNFSYKRDNSGATYLYDGYGNLGFMNYFSNPVATYTNTKVPQTTLQFFNTNGKILLSANNLDSVNGIDFLTGGPTVSIAKWRNSSTYGGLMLNYDNYAPSNANNYSYLLMTDGRTTFLGSASTGNIYIRPGSNASVGQVIVSPAGTTVNGNLTVTGNINVGTTGNFNEIAGGNLTTSATANTTITFPTGRFSAAPVVTATARNVTFSTTFATRVYVGNATATSVTIYANDAGGGVAAPVSWIAINNA